jgi:hypothetical protein
MASSCLASVDLALESYNRLLLEPGRIRSTTGIRHHGRPSPVAGRRTATPEMARDLLAATVDPRRYGTPHPLPTVAANSPAFSPEQMRRDPVWVNTNWLVARALRTHGFHRSRRQPGTGHSRDGRWRPHEYDNPFDATQPSRVTTRCQRVRFVHHVTGLISLLVDVAVRLCRHHRWVRIPAARHARPADGGGTVGLPVAAPSGCRRPTPLVNTRRLSTASAHRRRVLKASLSNSRATTEATAVETARLHLRQDCGACSTRSSEESADRPGRNAGCQHAERGKPIAPARRLLHQEWTGRWAMAGGGHTPPTTSPHRPLPALAVDHLSFGPRRLGPATGMPPNRLCPERIHNMLASDHAVFQG